MKEIILTNPEKKSITLQEKNGYYIITKTDDIYTFYLNAKINNNFLLMLQAKEFDISKLNLDLIH